MTTYYRATWYFKKTDDGYYVHAPAAEPVGVGEGESADGLHATEADAMEEAGALCRRVTRDMIEHAKFKLGELEKQRAQTVREMNAQTKHLETL